MSLSPEEAAMPDSPRRHGGAGVPDAPIAELVRELSEQTSRLVRQEPELARAELTAKGRRAGAGAGHSVKEDVEWTTQRARAGRR